MASRHIIDNEQETVVDHLRRSLGVAEAFDFVSAYFSIYGYELLMDELADVRRRLDRLYDLVETTTEFNMADFSHRIRDHKERQERLETAELEIRAKLGQRRKVLDQVETIAAYAQDMRRFLKKSELTERRVFIESFVKEILVTPDNALMRYTVPMPEDSPAPGMNSEDMALNGSVLSTVPVGGAFCLETEPFLSPRIPIPDH